MKLFKAFAVEKVEASRRTFLKTAGVTGGLALAAPVMGGMPLRAAFAGDGAELSPSVYLTLTEDGTVHVYIHRVEMGQGSRTGLPQIVADELDADWDRVNFIQSGADPKYGDQNTDGSTSIRKYYEPFRKAGATARYMLEEAAANAWGVDKSQVSLKEHKLHNAATGESADLGQFVADAAKLDVPSDDKLVYKTKADRKYVGKPIPIIDLDDIITGNATFGQDVMLDGMMFAVAARPPVVGGTVKSFNKDAAMAVAGVVAVIELPKQPAVRAFTALGGVAVVASNTWAAMKGREVLDVEWDHGANAVYSSESYEAQLWQSVEKGGRVGLKKGDVMAGLEGAARTYSADYFVPHLSHAPMEPPAATAHFAKDGSLDVYTHGQDPQVVSQVAAGYSGLTPDKIRVHSKLLGGAFGRKSKPDFVGEATVLAKAMGKPVKMVWTREDDIHHGFYHTVSAQRVDVGVTENGSVESWRHRAAYPSIASLFGPDPKGPVDFELSLGLLDLPFGCANMQVEACEAPAHVRIGWLRSVANIQQAFAVGSMVSEIAAGEGRDDLDVWLDLIGDDRLVDPSDSQAQYSNYNETLDKFPIDTGRLKATLQKAADMSGWGREMPEGVGLGIAVQRSFVSYVACAVEVDTRDGDPRVTKAWMAVDCGLAVNPDRVRAQMEGAVVFGTSIALYGKITAQDGAIEQSNYDTYQVSRIMDAPHTEVAIMDVDAPPGGVGEPGVPPVAPAIANAIFHATGKRHRRLPLLDV